ELTARGQKEKIRAAASNQTIGRLSLSKLVRFLGIEMNYLICLFLSLIFFAPTFAQSPVPIEKEPRHRLKFSNQYVRVFHVVIPPGDKSLFHTHLSDGLSVRLADASIRDEVLGGAAEDISVKRGEVTFGYRPGPLTHRVSCTSNTPFRN